MRWDDWAVDVLPVERIQDGGCAVDTACELEERGGEGKGGVELAEVTNCPTYYFHAGRCYQNSSFK